MTEIRNLAALGSRLGEEVAVSDWFDVTQERIAQFAEATEDRQWIHVDAARAAKESPYKTTIAHGFLTLSLASVLIRRTFSFEGVRMAINYGVNRVRFITAVPAGLARPRTLRARRPRSTQGRRHAGDLGDHAGTGGRRQALRGGRMGGQVLHGSRDGSKSGLRSEIGRSGIARSADRDRKCKEC